MSIEAAIDNTALKVAAITGIKRAYGAQAYDTAVHAMVEDIADTPVALVVLGGGTVSPGNWERLDYQVDVRVYFNSANVGAAYKSLAPFPALFVAAWRSDLDLGGVVTESNLIGWDQPVPEDVNGKQFLVLVFHTRVKELAGVTYAV